MSSSGMNFSNRKADSRFSVALYQNLRERAEALLRELDAFQGHVKSHGREKEVEIRVFRRGIESEVKGLQNMATIFMSEERPSSTTNDALDNESPHLHILKSSNLPFYEAVWVIAKTCCGVTALSKRFYSNQRQIFNETKGSAAPNVIHKPETLKRQSQKGVLVDIVAENGSQWIKVSTISEKRLLFEIAKEGWESYAGDISDDESDRSQICDADQRHHQLELVRLAHELHAASKATRIQFRHPHVVFVLPNIQEGQLRDIDAFVADLRATGATVQCLSGQVPIVLDKDNTTPVQPAILNKLLPGHDRVHRTNIINLDCTILLAIISDISHLRKDQISPDSHALNGTYHSAIVRQIEFEESNSIIQGDIYPVLTDRMLHCTSHAAERMREIVQCMGTPSECERADIILGEGRYADRDAESLRQSLQEQSVHAVPGDIRLPVKVVAFDAQDLMTSSTPESAGRRFFPHGVAVEVAKLMRLTPINLSVFLYGWKEQSLTFTSNRVVATGLLKAIDEVLDHTEHEENGLEEGLEEFYGPQIHICDTARSLIGKAKSKAPS
ncbi:hypothetical protein LTR84_009932 [Exophiala bonariae]|uniref:DUF1308 domain-containing protein n=1 Tax=Exophiala bonariae TaxID=1690606 RepID=A0AAV9NK52_9EURO|nr:hypothetical protein LTR84_009932 [Exophiala bonariae]